MGACLSRTDEHDVAHEFYKIRIELNTMRRHQASAIADLKRTIVTRNNSSVESDTVATEA